MRILVTGANGFVGRALCIEAVNRGHAVQRALRRGSDNSAAMMSCAVGDINAQTDWQAALRDIDVVIHLAARVHVMHETVVDPLAAFRVVNVEGTENLARQAALAGVKRLVYASSVKVNGEETLAGQAFCEIDVPHPQDPYAISKLEAEQALHRIAAETGLEVVIVRLPLVYGSGVKGNFEQMLKVLQKGVPLPLASVDNRRSLVYVGNLVDALLTCAIHPRASGQTYLVSDGEDISTPTLLRMLGEASGRPARLFHCPPWLLMAAAHLTGNRGQAKRLLGSLRINSSKICSELDWQPPCSLRQGLLSTAESFRD